MYDVLETATGANKQLWATITCKHCDRAGRYEITVPDNKVRLVSDPRLGSDVVLEMVSMFEPLSAAKLSVPPDGVVRHPERIGINNFATGQSKRVEHVGTRLAAGRR